MLNQEDVNMIRAGLVDSRVRETAGNPLKTHITGKLERTYCVFCGKEKGWVTRESYDLMKVMNVIVVCDPCNQSLGPPPGLQEVPEGVLEEFDHE